MMLAVGDAMTVVAALLACGIFIATFHIRPASPRGVARVSEGDGGR